MGPRFSESSKWENLHLSDGVLGLTTCTNARSAGHSSANISVQITERVAGSIADEVQRVTLRAEGDSTNGTFRLEVATASGDDRTRSRTDADHDDRFWTSQLGANASAEEVRIMALRGERDGVR